MAKSVISSCNHFGNEYLTGIHFAVNELRTLLLNNGITWVFEGTLLTVLNDCNVSTL
jgi:hypothetical protein